MTKTKKYTMCALITAVFWILSRFLPSFISSGFPGNISLQLVLSLLLLFGGWSVSCMISKGQFTSCINMNLLVFGCFEAFSILQIAFYIFQNWSYTGQYTSDIYGIPYSEYPTYFGGLILFEFLYIFLCYYLSKKSSTFGIPKQTTEQET